MDSFSLLSAPSAGQTDEKDFKKDHTINQIVVFNLSLCTLVWWLAHSPHREKVVVYVPPGTCVEFVRSRACVDFL